MYSVLNYKNEDSYDQDNEAGENQVFSCHEAWSNQGDKFLFPGREISGNEVKLGLQATSGNKKLATAKTIVEFFLNALIEYLICCILPPSFLLKTVPL